MDKELLRLAIIAIGIIVIIVMLLWTFFRKKQQQRNINFIDKGNPLDNIDKSLIISTENDDFDIVPIGAATDDQFDLDPFLSSDDGFDTESGETAMLNPQVQQINQAPLPSIIQFSIVANSDEGFNGEDLIKKFKQVGLEFGSMKIFERLDDMRRVDYAVASMVEPGTFPDTDVSLFNSPGLVFFIQPIELQNPLPIFDDFIQTINWLSNELGGSMLDHNREVLTDETIQSIRLSLGAT